jgi:hypothetical protein
MHHRGEQNCSKLRNTGCYIYICSSVFSRFHSATYIYVYVIQWLKVKMSEQIEASNENCLLSYFRADNIAPYSATDDLRVQCPQICTGKYKDAVIIKLFLAATSRPLLIHHFLFVSLYSVQECSLHEYFLVLVLIHMFLLV